MATRVTCTIDLTAASKLVVLPRMICPRLTCVFLMATVILQCQVAWIARATQIYTVMINCVNIYFSLFVLISVMTGCFPEPGLTNFTSWCCHEPSSQWAASGWYWLTVLWECLISFARRAPHALKTSVPSLVLFPPRRPNLWPVRISKLLSSMLSGSRYLGHGYIITSHSVLWDVITYPLRYLLQSPHMC